MIKLKQTIILVVSLFSSYAFAFGDSHFSWDGLGVDSSYNTGELTNGLFPNVTFKANKGFEMEKGDASEFLLQPERLPSNFLDSTNDAFNFGGTTLAMIVIDHGKIVYKKNVESSNSEFNSWSIAKSITSILIGEALCQGDIKSLDDHAETYVPEIKGSTYGRATIKQLLTMTSGSPAPSKSTGENAGDFSELTHQLKGHVDFINRTKDIEPSNDIWIYDNLNTDTLGLVMDSLKGTNRYMQDFLYAAGVQHESHWIKERDGHINTAYGYGAQLEDWAHIAQYSLDILKGRTNNKCMQKYMFDATTPSAVGREWFDPGAWLGADDYGYSMWVRRNRDHGYSWLGNYGQKVWVDPKHELILIIFNTRTSWKQVNNLVNYWIQLKAAHNPKNDEGDRAKAEIKGTVRVMPIPSK